MKPLLAAVCLLGFTMAVAGQDPNVSGLVGPIPKKLIPPDDGVTEFNGMIYPNKAAAAAAEKQFLEDQKLKRGVAAKMDEIEAISKKLKEEEDRKVEDWIWGFGIFVVVCLGYGLWWLFIPKKRPVKPAGESDDNPFA